MLPICILRSRLPIRLRCCACCKVRVLVKAPLALAGSRLVRVATWALLAAIFGRIAGTSHGDRAIANHTLWWRCCCHWWAYRHQ